MSATLTSDTGTMSFVIALPQTADAVSRRDAQIRISSPETLSGVTVSITGQVVEMTSGCMTVPVSPGAAERWLAIIGLFSLDETSVSSITETSGGVTVTAGIEPERVFVAFPQGSSVPSEIRREDGTLTLSINEYKFTDTGTEGVE